jgi:DNA-binding transcriptional regulator YiaG
MILMTKEQIILLRKTMGLSPTRFAVMLGVTENAVRRWEMGDRHPRWETAERMNELWEMYRPLHPLGKPVLS